jgi:predicted transcriptional regulator
MISGMTSVTLNLTEEILERAKKAAEQEGIPLEKVLVRVVEDAFEDDDVYELNDEEARAIAEGIADEKAGRWTSHEEMMKKLSQNGR